MRIPRSLHTLLRLCSVMNPVLQPQKVVYMEFVLFTGESTPFSVVVEEGSGDVSGGWVSRILEGTAVLLHQQLT